MPHSQIPNLHVPPIHKHHINPHFTTSQLTNSKSHITSIHSPPHSHAQPARFLTTVLLNALVDQRHPPNAVVPPPVRNAILSFRQIRRVHVRSDRSRLSSSEQRKSAEITLTLAVSLVGWLNDIYTSESLVVMSLVWWLNSTYTCGELCAKLEQHPHLREALCSDLSAFTLVRWASCKAFYHTYTCRKPCVVIDQHLHSQWALCGDWTTFTLAVSLVWWLNKSDTWGEPCVVINRLRIHGLFRV